MNVEDVEEIVDEVKDNGRLIVRKESTLDELIDKGVINPEDTINYIEYYGQFIAFLRKYDGTTIDVTIEMEANMWKGELMVRIDEIYAEGKLTKEQIIQFVNNFHHADEFELRTDYARAWFD